MKFTKTVIATALVLAPGLSFADATLPAQKITAIDTAWDGQGVMFSFREGAQLEGCNSNKVLIKSGPLLDGILSIGMSAHFASRKVQFKVQGCSDGMMLGKAISLSDFYNTPGTRFTIPSNITQANLASLIDPNSASIFFITIDHNTTLRGGQGIQGTMGTQGSTGYLGGNFPPLYGKGGPGGAGGKAGNGSVGGWAINLAGFAGKKVKIINNGSITGGPGGNGGTGGTGGTGGEGMEHGTVLEGDNRWCGYRDGKPGGTGGPGGAGGIAAGGGDAIVNAEGVNLILTGNPLSNGTIGTPGAKGATGSTGPTGRRGKYCWGHGG